MTSIGYELIVISACVRGIARIGNWRGGRYPDLGTVENAMNLLNISPLLSVRGRGLIRWRR
jgi:L-arabinose transport system permease protein